MFSMEEEGSATRPPVPRKTPSQRNASQRVCPASDTDDDDDEDFILYPILSDPKKDVVDYLQNLVVNKQLSTSLPKNDFMYKVSFVPTTIICGPWPSF